MGLLDWEYFFEIILCDGMCQSGPSPENSSHKVFQKRRVGYTRVGGLKGKEQWGNQRKQIPPLHLEGKIGKGWGCQNLRAWRRSPLEFVLVLPRKQGCLTAAGTFEGSMRLALWWWKKLEAGAIGLAGVNHSCLDRVDLKQEEIERCLFPSF